MIQITLLTAHVCLKIKGRERAREKRGGISHSGSSQEVSVDIKRDQNKKVSRV